MLQRILIPFLLVVAILGGLSIYFSQTKHEKEEAADAKILPTIVLDAGHGGEDGGTVGDGNILEKDLNLAVTLRLSELLREAGYSVVLTRESDTLLYDRTIDYKGRKKALDLAARRKIAEETPNSIFVSIHMNSYPDSRYHGLQVWYSPNHPASKQIADTIQKTAKELLQPENNRQTKAATSAIYLLHNLQIPAVLIECGFLSNPEEAQKLANPEYQQSLAMTLLSALENACRDLSL